MGLLYGVTVNRKATFWNPKGTILLYSLASPYKSKAKEESKYKSFKTFTHVYIILATYIIIRSALIATKW